MSGVTYTVDFANASLTAGGDGLQVLATGKRLLLSPSSHSAAKVEVSFDRSGGWLPMTPSSEWGVPGGFTSFYVRLAAGVNATTGRDLVFVSQHDGDPVFRTGPRAPELDGDGNGLIKEAATEGGDQSQATIGTSASTPVPANANRSSLKIKSDDANTDDVYYKTDGTATTGNAYKLGPGESEIISSPEAVSMIAGAAGQLVYFDEESRAS